MLLLERAIAGFDRQEGRLSYLAIVALARQLPKNYDDKDEQDEPLNDDELRSEYDLSKLQGGIRGKYVERYRAGTNLALLAPEIRAAFPTDEAVNEALRSIMQGQSAT